MSILGLEKTPIGPVGRGFEMTHKHGRTFDRWEAHFCLHKRRTSGELKLVETVRVLITDVGIAPPENKQLAGMDYRLSRIDARHWRVYYYFREEA